MHTWTLVHNILFDIDVRVRARVCVCASCRRARIDSHKLEMENWAMTRCVCLCKMSEREWGRQI